MAAQQYQKQYGASPQTTISKITKLPHVKEDTVSLKLRIQEVNVPLFTGSERNDEIRLINVNLRKIT